MSGRPRRADRLRLRLPRRFSRSGGDDADRPPWRRRSRLHGRSSMTWRLIFWPTRVALIALAICGFLLAGQFAPAQAQQPICAVDLNGNGDAGDPGEVVSCAAMANDAWLCPIQQTMCVADAQEIGR